MEVEESLPDNYDWFEEQIAGHHPSVIKNGRREIGLLKKKGSSKILKPKQDASRGECEVSIYELMSTSLRNAASGDHSEDKDKNNVGIWSNVRPADVMGLAMITPHFHGMKCLRVDGLDVDFMMLEDMTSPYKHPAILDVKMGRVTYDPLASELKRERESSKYPPQKTLGFRLLGYRAHSKNGEVTARDKSWGISKNEETIGAGLEEFFRYRSNDPLLKAALMVEYEKIISWFESQRSFQFYASSLLIVYETDPNLPASPLIRMIDFSHVFPANNLPDENYLHGLRTLRQFLLHLPIWNDIASN